MDMKSILIFLAGAAVAALLVWGFVASQPAPIAQVPDTTQTDTTDSNSGGTGAGVAAGQPVLQSDGHYLYTVNYNSDIFTPAVLKIKRGDSVKFVNKDNLTMRVSVALNSTSTAGNVMDSHSVGKGGTYLFSFTTPGLWVIQNINESGSIGGGVINVQ